MNAETRELTNDELDTVSGGNPLVNVVVTIAKFLAEYDAKFGQFKNIATTLPGMTP